MTSVDDGDFPGGGPCTHNAAEKVCISNFKDYVGSHYVTSTLDATWMLPTKDSWAQK